MYFADGKARSIKISRHPRRALYSLIPAHVRPPVRFLRGSAQLRGEGVDAALSSVPTDPSTMQQPLRPNQDKDEYALTQFAIG